MTLRKEIEKIVYSPQESDAVCSVFKKRLHDINVTQNINNSAEYYLVIDRLIKELE